MDRHWNRKLMQAAVSVLGILVLIAACDRTPPAANDSPAGAGHEIAAAPRPPTSASSTDPKAATDVVPDTAPPAPAAEKPASSGSTPLRPEGASAGNPPAAEAPVKTTVPPEKSRVKQADVADADHREAIFEKWPAPKFALFITGQQGGFLEPCGCTGLTNQKGGLARRHTLYRELTQRGWPLVAVDVGNQIRRFGRQGEIKFQRSAEALKKIGYQAIALGADDLRLSVGELAAATLAEDGGSTPFVCANAAILERSLTPSHHILEVVGKKLGITAVLGAELQEKIISGEIAMVSPQAGLDAVLPKLREAKCDLLVLLAHASIEESHQLARQYPDFQIVVTSGGTGEPLWQPERIPGTNSVLIQVGLKGMFVGVLGVYDDPQMPWRYQRVPLDARFADSPEMLNLLASYQKQLETVRFEGLGLTPLPHPTGRAFMGSEKCGECHTKAYESWKQTGHSHATDSLVHPPERSEIARHYDPECLSCHVTGWDPQKMFPYTSGFLSREKTPLMQGSGCENCHGPGSAHVAAQEGDNAADQLRTQHEMRLRLSDAEKKCQECHDPDNSPDFHATGAFEKYWRKVEHKGLD